MSKITNSETFRTNIRIKLKEIFPAGKTPNSNSSECELCGIGKYSGIGAPMCSPCLPGTHAPGPGTTECTRCVTTFGAGFSSFEGSASCETCVQGYYFEDSTCKVSASKLTQWAGVGFGFWKTVKFSSHRAYHASHRAYHAGVPCRGCLQTRG